MIALIACQVFLNLDCFDAISWGVIHDSWVDFFQAPGKNFASWARLIAVLLELRLGYTEHVETPSGRYVNALPKYTALVVNAWKQRNKLPNFFSVTGMPQLNTKQLSNLFIICICTIYAYIIPSSMPSMPSIPEKQKRLVSY